MSELTGGDERQASWSWLVGALLVLSALVWCTVKPLTADAPSSPVANVDAFSASRAMAAVSSVLVNERPHPVASLANAEVGHALVQQLQQLGYVVEQPVTPSCRYFDRAFHCAIVHNIVARFSAAALSSKAVLVTAHYDSVGAGPGVADDMSNVGILLELARLQSSHSLQHLPWELAFTDGEEPGSLGADALANGGLDLTHYAYVLNLEARGTSGAPIMFEAGPGSGSVLAAYLRNVRPVSGGSYVLSLYHLLPNDTDYTLFRQKGLPGLNFAFAEGWTRYHSPRDDFAHVNLASVQAQGDAVVKTLAAMDSETAVNASPTADFIDVAHLGVWSWNAAWTWPLNAASWIILVIAVAGLRRVYAQAWKSLLGSLLKPALVLLVAMAVMAGIDTLWHLLAGRAEPWLAQSGLAWLAPSALCLAMVLGVWRTPSSQPLPWLYAGQVTFLNLLLLALTALDRGLASLLLIQTLFASLILMLMGWSQACRRWQVGLYLANFLIAALVCVPAAKIVAVMFTPALMWAVMIPVLWLLFAAVPLLLCTTSSRFRRYLAALAAVCAVVGIVALPMRSASSVDDPAEANIYRIQDADKGQAWIAAGHAGYRVPASLAHAAAFSATTQAPWPRELFGPKYVAKTEPLTMPSPHMRICQPGNGAAGTTSLCSDWASASFDTVSLIVPKGMAVSAIHFGGKPFAVPQQGLDTGLVVNVYGAESASASLSIDVSGALPQQMLAMGGWHDLPADTQRVADCRSGSEVPKNSGDTSVVFTRQPWH